MTTPHNLQRSIALIFISVVTTGAAVGCDHLDDIAEEILKARDAGTSSDVQPPPLPSCDVDADCRTFSDYCTGCACRALGVKEADPVCSGPGVQCLVDPCMKMTASCQTGRCVLTPPPPPPAPVACVSSSDCAATAYCTTETGTCNRPPGCGIGIVGGGAGGVCPAVCYGTCEPRTNTGTACGPKTCAAGMVCCNESCGICTAPNGACTQQFCN